MKNYSKGYTRLKQWDEKYKGVYGIFDGVTGECLYIGSSVGVNRRLTRHKTCVRDLDYAEKWYPSQVDLYKSLSTHSSLAYELLDECSVKILRPMEQFFMTVFKPKYNKNKAKIK